MFEDFLTSKNDLVVCRDNFADIVKNLNVQLIKWQETITDNKKASKEQYKSNLKKKQPKTKGNRKITSNKSGLGNGLTRVREQHRLQYKLN